VSKRAALVRAPDPDLGAARLAHPLNADAGVLPTGRRLRWTDHFPLAGLVGEPVADLQLHREDTALGRCFGSRFFSSRDRVKAPSPNV
jgi:hypothetical protein